MLVVQAFKYKIDPSKEQIPALCSNLGGSRFAYNHLLSLIKANHEQINAEKKTPEGQVTPYQRTDQISLMYLWHETKDEAAGSWRLENSSQVYNDAAGRLASAFKNYYEGTAKFPTYAKKQWAGSAKFSRKAVTILGRHHVKLSRVGSLKTYESMRKMCRHIERGTGELVSATLKRESGGWFIVFTVKVQKPEPKPRPAGSGRRVIGIDLGLRTLMVGATPEGERVSEVPNPRNFQKSQRKLARAQKTASRRQGPEKGQIASKRYMLAQAKVRKIHARVKNQRTALAHEASSRVVKECDVIVLETLTVKNMVLNRRLSKAISDAGWGQLVQMIEYKASWAGVEVVKAPRFYPSSKTCSNCQHVKTKLRLSEREYECSNCGKTLDRDLNAATNLARLALAQETDSALALEGPAGTHSVAGRGGICKTEAGLPAEAGACEASTLLPV